MFCYFLIVFVENTVDNYVESKPNNVESSIESKPSIVEAFQYYTYRFVS